MALRQTTPPAEEPVSLAEAKAHLRVDMSDDDALIGMLITAARAHAESICRRAFVTQSWDLFLDDFPQQRYCGTVAGTVDLFEMSSGWAVARNFSARIRAGRIDLPFPRLQSVDAVKYRDAAGVLQTLAPTAYVVDSAGEPGALVPAPGSYWPATQGVINGVQISYTAGYGTATDVPAGIKSWMLMRIGALYENREEIVVGQRLTSVDLPFVDGLLDPYRIRSYS